MCNLFDSLEVIQQNSHVCSLNGAGRPFLSVQNIVSGLSWKLLWEQFGGIFSLTNLIKRNSCTFVSRNTDVRKVLDLCKGVFFSTIFSLQSKNIFDLYTCKIDCDLKVQTGIQYFSWKASTWETNRHLGRELMIKDSSIGIEKIVNDTFRSHHDMNLEDTINKFKNIFHEHWNKFEYFYRQITANKVLFME